MTELDKIIETINKEHKYDIVNKGLRAFDYKKIEFTSSRLNYMTYGGVPRGTLIELAGAENSGKTTLALDIVKNAQLLFNKEYVEEVEKLSKEAGKGNSKRYERLLAAGQRKVVYADCENTLDENWARLIGVDFDNIITITPQQESAEELFDMFISMMETGEVGLLVIDSLGVLMSQQAYDKSITEKTYAGISMALTLFGKKASLLCSKYGITLVGINQLRDDLTSSYNSITTVGGRGWKHFCSVRFMLNKSDFIDEGNNKIAKNTAENPAGNLVDITIIKTKAFKPNRRRGVFTIRYDIGIDDISDLLDIALKYEVILRKGAWYYILDENSQTMNYNGKELSFQGKSELLSFLRENKDFTLILKAHLLKLIE